MNWQQIRKIISIFFAISGLVWPIVVVFNKYQISSVQNSEEISDLKTGIHDQILDIKSQIKDVRQDCFIMIQQTEKNYIDSYREINNRISDLIVYTTKDNVNNKISPRK